MGKRDLEKERQQELSAIWGSEVDGESRFPKRRRIASKVLPAAVEADVPVDPDVLTDLDSDLESNHSDREEQRKEKLAKKSAGKKKVTFFRLHCFVEPGTEINAVRTVFEHYEPKVDLRTSQKGNLLNKTQYAVLTFRNKALALHAVKTLDGTNQRDLLGVKALKLNMMLNRQQSKVARLRANRERRRSKKISVEEELEKDREFIRGLLRQHGKR